MLLYNIIPETRKALFVINFDFSTHQYSNNHNNIRNNRHFEYVF